MGKLFCVLFVLFSVEVATSSDAINYCNTFATAFCDKFINNVDQANRPKYGKNASACRFEVFEDCVDDWHSQYINKTQIEDCVDGHAVSSAYNNVNSVTLKDLTSDCQLSPVETALGL